MATSAKEGQYAFIEGLEQQDTTFYQFCEVLKRKQGNIDRHDSKAVAGQDMEALRRELYVELLPLPDQTLFDRFTTGEVGEYTDAFQIYKPYSNVTVSDIKEMKEDQLKDLALKRGVLGLAARIYLSRYIETNQFQRSNQSVGDISPKYWWEFGSADILIHIVTRPEQIVRPLETFHYILTNRPYGIYIKK
jgi:hypothetical protein